MSATKVVGKFAQSLDIQHPRHLVKGSSFQSKCHPPLTFICRKFEWSVFGQESRSDGLTACPVIKDDSLEHMKDTTFAISSGYPILGMTCLLMSCKCTPQCVLMGSSMKVIDWENAYLVTEAFKISDFFPTIDHCSIN
jgi:hypothetical protein